MHLIIFIAELATKANASAMNIIKWISGLCECFAYIVPDHSSQSEWAGLQTRLELALIILYELNCGACKHTNIP